MPCCRPSAEEQICPTPLFVANPAALIFCRSSAALGKPRGVCTQLSSGHGLNLIEKIGKVTKKRLGKNPASLHIQQRQSLSSLPCLQPVVHHSICCTKRTICSSPGLGGEEIKGVPHPIQSQPWVMGQKWGLARRGWKLPASEAGRRWDAGTRSLAGPSALWQGACCSGPLDSAEGPGY